MLNVDLRFYCKGYQVNIKKIPADRVPVICAFFEYQEKRADFDWRKIKFGAEFYPGVVCTQVNYYFELADFQYKE